MRTAIVTDSTADIPAQLAEELNIHIVPAVLVVDGEQHIDGEGISREELYQRLPHLKRPPSTAAPSAGMFEQAYTKVLAAGFERIVSIHVASALSGMLNTARLAAEKFKAQIKLVDSCQASLGLGFQAIAAAEAAALGASLQQIMECIASIRERIKVVAMLDTLEQLKRSGRVSWAQAGLGSLLKIKPFIELRDGRVLRLEQVRTRAKGIARLLAMLKELGSLERLAVIHTNAEREAHALLESLKAHLPHPPLVVNVTPIIGAHVGVGGLGFAAVRAAAP